jgi:hypothetical protein
VSVHPHHPPLPLNKGAVQDAAHRFPGKARADEKTNLIIVPLRCNAERTRDDIIYASSKQYIQSRLGSSIILN